MKTRAGFLTLTTAVALVASSMAPAPSAEPDQKGNQGRFAYPVVPLGFEDRGANDLAGKAGDTLFAKLAARPGVYLVERTDPKKVFDEQQLNLTGAVKADEAVRVGQRTGAKVLVTGSVVQIDKWAASNSWPTPCTRASTRCRQA